jgi:hypothetical protein
MSVHYLVFDRCLQQLARSFLEQLFEIYQDLLLERNAKGEAVDPENRIFLCGLIEEWCMANNQRGQFDFTPGSADRLAFGQWVTKHSVGRSFRWSQQMFDKLEPYF